MQSLTVQLTPPNIAVVVVHMNIGVPSVVVVSSSSGSSKQHVVSAGPVVKYQLLQAPVCQSAAGCHNALNRARALALVCTLRACSVSMSCLLSISSNRTLRELCRCCSARAVTAT
jgi:hypothetical protein